MSFGGGTSQESIPKFKSFVSEAELEEKRKKRQEEWDKVRTAEDPVEAPEEEYDPRSLFERLEEQRLKKQADYEEAHKLKNMIRGLDDDEVTFLEYVDVQKQKAESQRLKEDMQELEEYRKAVASLSEEAMEAKRLEMKKAAAAQGVSTGRRSQLALLSAAVKRKSADSSSDLSKKQHTNGSGQAPCNGGKALGDPCGGDAPAQQTVLHAPTALSCLGVLPGLGVYTDSSDSENSSFSDDADLDLDLIGRRRVQHEVDHSPKPN
uniref:Putative nefa-interacting nuclear protein nip30 n=1 Tax=Ixodes ricinus TaxID=34613 RepID=V5HK30_IXORI